MTAHHKHISCTKTSTASTKIMAKYDVSYSLTFGPLSALEVANHLPKSREPTCVYRDACPAFANRPPV